MARELSEMVADALADILKSGWAKYLELEDGTQVRCTWHRDGDLEWVEVEGPEVGEAFKITVTAEVFTLPPIGPEDDGALRAELSAGLCGDCGDPLGTNPGPCEACAEHTLEQPTEHADPEPSTWGEVHPGDLVQGGDGEWYEVHAAGPLGSSGLRSVVLLIAGEQRAYDMLPSGPVQRRRGPEAQAIDTMRAAGLDPEVL